MKSTKIIGLTGGIGSGKTTVTNYMQESGVRVYIADLEAKNLMHTDKNVREQVLATFGQEVYKGHKLQTKVLAAKVFKDKNQLKKLNAIVHPAVRLHMRQFVNRSRKAYVVVENAILFEAGFDKMCDYIVCVTAPLETRIARVIKRDKVTREQVLDRINNQWDEAMKIKLSDYIINTDREITQTHVQVDELMTLLDRKFK